MKKFTYAALILMLTFLAACSSNDEASKESNSNTSDANSADTEKKSDEGSMKVDKGLLSVEITIPASMFEGEDIEQTIADAKEQGVKEVIENEDGSLTYKMSKSVHKDMMKEIGTSIDQAIEETKNSGDFPSVKDITHNDSYSEFTMIVDKEKYENSMDGFATITLGMTGMIYQIYDGADEDKQSVTIYMEDEATGEVFDEAVYPDDMEKTEEN